MAIAPTPVVALNRAVAVAEVEGAPAALAELDALDLGGYHLFHATRAEILRRLGQIEAADVAYGRRSTGQQPGGAALSRGTEGAQPELRGGVCARRSDSDTIPSSFVT